MSPKGHNNSYMSRDTKKLPEELIFAKLPKRKPARYMCVVVRQYQNVADEWPCRSGGGVYKYRSFRLPGASVTLPPTSRVTFLKLLCNFTMCKSFAFASLDFENRGNTSTMFRGVENDPKVILCMLHGTQKAKTWRPSLWSCCCVKDSKINIVDIMNLPWTALVLASEFCNKKTSLYSGMRQQNVAKSR